MVWYAAVWGSDSGQKIDLLLGFLDLLTHVENRTVQHKAVN